MPIIVNTKPGEFKYFEDGRPLAGSENYTYYDYETAPQELKDHIDSGKPTIHALTGGKPAKPGGAGGPTGDANRAGAPAVGGGGKRGGRGPKGAGGSKANGRPGTDAPPGLGDSPFAGGPRAPSGPPPSKLPGGGQSQDPRLDPERIARMGRENELRMANARGRQGGPTGQRSGAPPSPGGPSGITQSGRSGPMSVPGAPGSPGGGGGMRMPGGGTGAADRMGSGNTMFGQPSTFPPSMQGQDKWPVSMPGPPSGQRSGPSGMSLGGDPSLPTRSSMHISGMGSARGQTPLSGQMSPQGGPSAPIPQTPNNMQGGPGQSSAIPLGSPGSPGSGSVGGAAGTMPEYPEGTPEGNQNFFDQMQDWMNRDSQGFRPDPQRQERISQARQGGGNQNVYYDPVVGAWRMRA